MIALDTNVLARLLLRDDERQYAKALALLQSDGVFTAPVTVVVELVWVLESNECTVDDIVKALTLLLGLPNFQPQQAPALQVALQDYAKGMDFADALHLALSQQDDSFRTFDKAFAKLAQKADSQPPVSLV